MKKTYLLVLPLLVLLAGCNKSNSTDTVTTTQNPPAAQVYENSEMKVTLADGWTAKEAEQNVGGAVSRTQPNPAAVNIIKGNYILYINTQAMQASGVQGGRFAEIAMGAPSADAVVTVQPSPPCGTSESNPATTGHPRMDWYVSSSDNKNSDVCKLPTGSKTVWYFSYITDSNGDYFNYYNPNAGGPTGYVITMAYNSKDVNSLPLKGSSELASALTDMTNMVQSLVIKQH